MTSGNRQAKSGFDVGHRPNLEARILVVLRGFDDADRICEYVCLRAKSDPGLSVSLLFLVPLIRDWHVLQFRTEAEVRRHLWKRGEAILADAAGMLRKRDISTSVLIRDSVQIDDAFSVAEEANCSEIVIRLPPWHERLFGCDELHLKRAARGHRVHLI